MAASLSALRISEYIDATIEGYIKSIGFSNDPSSLARAFTKYTGISVTTAIQIAGATASTGAIALENAAKGVLRDLEIDVQNIGFAYEEKQAAYEFQQSYYDLVDEHFRMAALVANYQETTQKVRNLEVAGQSLQAERETFRQRAAAIITGYRTKDLTFRTFRNEALE